MKTKVDSKPISSKLMKLDVGDSTSYHRTRRDSVTTARDRLQRKYPDMKWRLSKVDTDSFKVTRTV